MKSSGLLDLAAVAPLPLEPTKMPASDAPAGGFSDLLAQASGEAAASTETADTESEIELELNEETDAPETEEEEELVALVAPIVCFCPPPDVKVAMAAGNSDLAEAALEGADAVSLETNNLTPEAEIAASSEGDVSGERQGEKSEANFGEKLAAGLRPLSAAPLTTTAAQAAIEIPKELLPVDPEVISQVAAEDLKQSISDAVKEADGTLVAQQGNEVKKSEKTAEIAPAIAQKMPIQEPLRRIVPEISRYESFQVSPEFNATPEADFGIEMPSELNVLKAVDAAQLVETIRTEVTNLRQRGDVSMTVVLKPDNGTQLQVEVSIARDGTIQAQARCDRGDYQSLNAQWPQLQQSLAAHGIRMTDLSGQNNAGHQFGSNSGEFHNFDRQQNPENRNQRETFEFEEEFAAVNSRAATSNQRSTPTTPAASRRWQSWA